MTGTEFILYVKAKLNRLDSSSYEDVRPEEILFFANEALKTLTLEFDMGRYSPLIDIDSIRGYLASMNIETPSTDITDNKFAVPTMLKLKDLEAWVVIGTETGWMPAKARPNKDSSLREDNVFTKSYPDEPYYRYSDDNIKFDIDSTFNVTKVKYKYLRVPPEIVEASVLNYTFMSELENKTVTLLLENLEGRRLGTQPAVSKL